MLKMGRSGDDKLQQRRRKEGVSMQSEGQQRNNTVKTDSKMQCSCGNNSCILWPL